MEDNDFGLDGSLAHVRRLNGRIDLWVVEHVVLNLHGGDILFLRGCVNLVGFGSAVEQTGEAVHLIFLGLLDVGVYGGRPFNCNRSKF